MSLDPHFLDLFPDDNLMRRPKLLQSSTFFTWMRLCYPAIRDDLQQAVLTAKQELLGLQRDHILQLLDGKGPVDLRLARAIVNLQVLP